MTKGGKVHTIYNFGNKPDGSLPLGSLLFSNGQLYGVTNFGGTKGRCIVYSITPTGTIRVLHNFGKKPDAAEPESGLIEVSGTLYGAASSGGFGYGAVYRIKPDGISYRVLYGFHGNPNDGSTPYATLTYDGGMFYATTYEGGKYDSGTSNTGEGSVFSLTPNGTEHVLLGFQNTTSDGGLAASPLMERAK